MIYTNKVITGTYEMLAREYYNPRRHPTCANFRQASILLLRKWKEYILSQRGIVCEVGPGKSLVAKLLAQNNCSLSNLLLIDSSPSMLAYSEIWCNYGARLTLGNAESMDIPSGSVSIMISSLGDPYNTPVFWKEMSRILNEGSLGIFTIPSYEWSTAYRSQSGEDYASADFELVDGRHIRVPSWIYPVDEQIKLIESAGLIVEEVAQILISDLNTNQLSPKIRVLDRSELDIVTGYLARKSFLR